MRKLFSLTLLFLIILTACSPALGTAATPIGKSTIESVPPFPMTFMAGYKPQANLPFVGVYIAKEKGFFTDENLDVTVEHSTGNGEHLQLLVTGKVQVTTMDASTLLQRRSDPGLPVVSIALIGQKGQQAFAALASSGLKSPKDWEGKIVGYKGTPPPDLYALLAAAGADVTRLKLVNVGFDPRVLIEKQVDVYPLFKSNEPYLLKKWGAELTIWDASDFGVPTMGLAYVSSEQFIATHPKELTRFLSAALKGINYAETHQEEALDIVMKYAGAETDRAHMKYMLETELKDAKSVNGYGWQSAGQWQALADMLVKYKALPEGTDAHAAFSSTLWDLAHK